MLTVRLQHVQFDTDVPPRYAPVLTLMDTYYGACPVDIQYAICQNLETHYGYPVDYVVWEAE